MSHPQNFSPGQFESLINRCPHSVYRPPDSSVAPCSLCLCATRPSATPKASKRLAVVIAEQKADIDPVVKAKKQPKEFDEALDEFSNETSERNAR